MGYKLIEAEIKPGEHICSFYENKMEQFQIIIPFIIEGLVRKEKCLYIADENTVEEIKAGLHMHGIDVDQNLRTGQLNIMTARESYLKSSRFILDDMISQLNSFVDQALNEGYSGARVSGEMTWLIRNLSSLEEFQEYEKTLNEVFAKRPVKLLCQYNSKKFFGNIILGALKTHPRVLIGLDLYKNVYYRHKDGRNKKEKRATIRKKKSERYHIEEKLPDVQKAI